MFVGGARVEDPKLKNPISQAAEAGRLVPKKSGLRLVRPKLFKFNPALCAGELVEESLRLLGVIGAVVETNEGSVQIECGSPETGHVTPALK